MKRNILQDIVENRTAITAVSVVRERQSKEILPKPLSTYGDHGHTQGATLEASRGGGEGRKEGTLE